MDTILKFDNQAREKIVEKLSSEAMKLFVEKTKSAADSGTFEMVITTDDVDRMGEMIKLDGWDFTNYMKSPVVLWGHNYSLPPIGITTEIRQDGNKKIAIGKFAPTEFAQNIRVLYDMGMNRASSVGFIVNEQEGNIITKAELLEWSFVSVPANPYALSLRDLGIVQSEEVAGMIVKSIVNSMKIAQTIKDGEPVKPSEEKPAEVKPEEAKPEEKGAVADELTAEQAMDAKYENLGDVFEVMYAMADVYCDMETPVADFTKLLTETIGILQTIVDGTYTEPDDTMKGLLGAISKSKKVNEARLIALESILKSEDGSAVNTDEDEEEESEETEESKDILEKRKLLQESSTIIRDALTALKPKVKELY